MYEKFGEIPQDILEGTRRSNFAPPITALTVMPMMTLTVSSSRTDHAAAR